MLGKWLWHLGTDSPGLWRRILVEFNSLDVSKWVTPMLTHTTSSTWKSIIPVKSNFDNWIRYRAHNGLKLKF